MADERKPIADLLPRVGRARDLDIDFLELFADLIAQVSALRIMLSGQPVISDKITETLKKKEDETIARFERLLSDLQKGNNRGGS